MKKVDSRKKYSEMEKEQLAFWEENRTFEKSVEKRSINQRYVFYDGPPFITGVPHHGTLLSSIIKDVVPRYWTMKGKRVERVWGWDCHGLPAENLVEKKLGIKDKREVEKVGLEKYIETCHTEMVQGGNLWEETIERIGRWVNFKGAYKTMSPEFMESVWWAFKELYNKGKIYEGEKVLMYCTRCATPISKAEVAMDNSYQKVTDPSVYVKFKMEGEKNTYFLAWTTTPWTLSANVALAVNPEIDYVRIGFNEEIYLSGEWSLIDGKETKSKYEQGVYILAKDVFWENMTGAGKLTEIRQVVNGDDKEKNDDLMGNISFNDFAKKYNIDVVKGKDLVGLKYQPLFENQGEKAHKIVAANYVTTEDGTGIVHIAPAYGEEDYTLAQKESLPVVHTVDDNGLYKTGLWQGKSVWEVNKDIAKKLLTEGKVFKIDYIQHDYPHCHRCNTKLMYRAHPSWFMDIAGQKSEMLEKNEINWFPSYIKEGRWENTIKTAPDWNLSRDRFWATAIPVWKCQSKKCKHIKVVGGYDELEELSGQRLEDYHRPYVDKVTFSCQKCGGKMRRIEKVLDCWFESGSMPFAQFHYPFENKEKFEQNFPGDFISEYVGQVRAWFYYVHAVSIGLFGKEAFKNVIVTGTIAGNDGKKMSKSLGNYTDPKELMDKYSADALRFLLISSPLLNGEDFSLIDKDVADTQRKLSTLWQSYSFFVMYATVDNWKPESSDAIANKIAEKKENILDRWIISRLNETVLHVDRSMQDYDLPTATKPILEFIDDLSNWYIRRSRRRFWKSEDDGDKNAAYETLYYVLVNFAKIIAPITPFIAEEIYKNLTEEESVHLVDFPEADKSLIDLDLSKKMKTVRKAIELGLSLRAQNSLKVRQPLSLLQITGDKIEDELLELVKEEVNVKKVELVNKIKNGLEGKEDEGIKVGLDIEITQELKLEGQMRELIRQIQQARKEAGLEIDDRIKLSILGADEIVKKFVDEIKREVLAVELNTTKSQSEEVFGKEVKIEDEMIKLEISKKE